MLSRIGYQMKRNFNSVQINRFKILGIQQIAVGADDKNELHKFWVNILGIPKVGEYKSEVPYSNLFNLSIDLRKKM